MKSLYRIDPEFTFDIWRSLVLARFVSAWGVPELRTKSKHPEQEHPIEVYYFPGELDQEICRIATVGLSLQRKTCNHNFGNEFFFVFPKDLGGAQYESVVNFVLDFSVHCLNNISDLSIGTTTPPTSLCPKNWSTKAVLIDEPRGEPDDIASIAVGNESVDVYWIVMITENEYKIIKNEGLDKFDAAFADGGDVTDLHR